MNKELHVYMGMTHPMINTMSISLAETEWQLNHDVERINTPQTHVISTTWLVKGYRIFVHMLDDKIVEMKLGYMGDNLKEIRVAHNLEKMVLAGCFGNATLKDKWV